MWSILDEPDVCPPDFIGLQLPAEEEDVVLVSALARMSRLEPSNFYSQWSMIDAFEDNIKSLLMRLDTRGTRERELRWAYHEESMGMRTKGYSRCDTCVPA